MLSSQEKQHPINIDPGIADKFKDLQTDIQKFSTDFLEYLKNKKQDLDQEAQRLQGLINRFRDELEVCVLCSRYVLILKFFSQTQRSGILSHISQNYLVSELPLV